jgi:hypothetical protein
MSSSPSPARIPERQPEPAATIFGRRQTWTGPEIKTRKFIIKVAGAIPS